MLQPRDRRHHWHRSAGAAQNGPYTVTVQAASGSNVATEVFTWNITSAISLPVIADQPGTENSAIGNMTISGTVVAPHVSGANLTYSATGLPPGLQINTSPYGNTAVGVISGTIALALRPTARIPSLSLPSMAMRLRAITRPRRALPGRSTVW